ncbi:hypothetical protein JCM18750_00290 [Halostagnicola bangensis]
MNTGYRTCDADHPHSDAGEPNTGSTDEPATDLRLDDHSRWVPEAPVERNARAIGLMWNCLEDGENAGDFDPLYHLANPNR